MFEKNTYKTVYDIEFFLSAPSTPVMFRQLFTDASWQQKGAHWGGRSAQPQPATALIAKASWLWLFTLFGVRFYVGISENS